MKTIVYLMYGNKREYNLELTYSLLSAAYFLRQADEGIQIVLITTEDARRHDLPVRHLIVSDAELKAWMLDGQYNHAAKVSALLRAMDEFPGKVALVDTDTYFTRHPKHLFERISPGQALMCDYESPLGKQAGWSELLAGAGGSIAGYAVEDASVMFNSGVVGVDTSLRTALDDTYPLMRGLLAIKPVFNIEQYAFSAILSAHASVSVCSDILRHYWGFDRRFIHAQLDELFPVFSSASFEQQVLQFRALGMPEKPFLDRLRGKLKRLLRSNNADYGFAYLAYRCALSSKKPAVADVWANTALDALSSKAADWTDGSLAYAKRDFRKFRVDRLDENSWMQAETRARWHRYWKETQYC